MSGKTYLNLLKDSMSNISSKGKIKILNEADSPVKIPINSNDFLGLSLDEPLNKFKAQITSGEKSWEKLSQQINTLYVFNKDKHPDVAKKASDKREALAGWVENKRKENPEFGK